MATVDSCDDIKVCELRRNGTDEMLSVKGGTVPCPLEPASEIVERRNCSRVAPLGSYQRLRR